MEALAARERDSHEACVEIADEMLDEAAEGVTRGVMEALAARERDSHEACVEIADEMLDEAAEGVTRGVMESLVARERDSHEACVEIANEMLDEAAEGVMRGVMEALAARERDSHEACVGIADEMLDEVLNGSAGLEAFKSSDGLRIFEDSKEEFSTLQEQATGNYISGENHSSLVDSNNGVENEAQSPVPSAANKQLIMRRSSLNSAKVLTVRAKSPTRENSSEDAENSSDHLVHSRPLHVSPSSAVMRRTGILSKESSFNIDRTETVDDDFCIDATFTEVSLERLRTRTLPPDVIKRDGTEEIDLDLLFLDRGDSLKTKNLTPASKQSGTCFDDGKTAEADETIEVKTSSPRPVHFEETKHASSFDRHESADDRIGSSDLSMDEASEVERSYDRDSFDNNDSFDRDDDHFKLAEFGNKPSFDVSNAVTKDSPRNQQVQKILEQLNLSPKSRSSEGKFQPTDSSFSRDKTAERDLIEKPNIDQIKNIKKDLEPVQSVGIVNKGNEAPSDGMKSELALELKEPGVTNPAELYSKRQTSTISKLPPVQLKSRRPSTDTLLENFLGLESSHPVSFNMFKGMLDNEKSPSGKNKAASSAKLGEENLSTALEENKRIKHLLTAAVKLQEAANAVTDEDFALDDATLLRLKLQKAGKNTVPKRVCLMFILMLN